MQIKRFKADTMARALKAIKAELGADAVILETRRLGNKGGVEVTAAYDQPAKPTKPVLAKLPAEMPPVVVDPPWVAEALKQREAGDRTATPVNHRPSAAETTRPVMATPPSAPMASAADNASFDEALAPIRADLASMGTQLQQMQPVTLDGLTALRSEMQRMQRLMGSLVAAHQVDELPEALRDSYARLLELGLPEPTAAELVQQLPDHNPELLTETIARRITVANPLQTGSDSTSRQARMMLVGPTGVGKTTTIAKLAAHYAIARNQKVALITLDTFRIGAVEQLARYAEIIGVPCRVAANRAELEEQLAHLSDADLVLIDTAGRSPRDPDHVDELMALGLDGIQVHLVLPATHTPGGLEEIVSAYAKLAPEAMILSKLDEARTLGAAVHTALSSRLELSYLTDGQRIPDDLHRASGMALANRLLVQDVTT